MLTNQKINHKLAITFEIYLLGKVSAIGGIDLKILGGIEAGVTTFLFPKENEEDFNKFKKQHEDNDILEGINFHIIETIEEAIELSIVK